MIIGNRYEALNTSMVRKNGLVPGNMGYVTFVDGEAISLEFPVANLSLKVPRNLFGMNFRQCQIGMPENAGYRAARHAVTKFE